MEQNIYLALAQAMWKRGEDGEVIARELAYAFIVIVEEVGRPPLVDFERFLHEYMETKKLP